MPHRITSLADYQHIRASFRWPAVAQFNFGADILDDWGTRTPDHLALRVDDGRGSQTRTFSQLSRISHRIGAGLQALGLQPGDKVVIVLPRVVEWWEVLAGALTAGLVASPGTTLLTPKDLAYRLRAAEVSRSLRQCRQVSRLDRWNHWQAQTHPVAACAAGRWPRS